jgi:prophage regulatory protein
MTTHVEAYDQKKPTGAVNAQRLLDSGDLRALGINYGRVHLHRLIQARKFPAPVKLGENRNAWVASEIHAWIDARIHARDTVMAGTE